ncbi:MAG: pilus assembly protein CpaE [Jatrophihabitantaceae bacterium]
MISHALARRLRDGGVRWHPAPGDRFYVADRGMDDVFTLSEMTVEMHEFPGGREIAFNGTVEWALDSVEAGQSVWLPSEAQLRELLGVAFHSLIRAGGGWQVSVRVDGNVRKFGCADAAEAYGLALLYLVTGA